MVYRGTVRNGVVVLPTDVQLPEGQDVTVSPIASPSTASATSVGKETLRNGVPVFPRSDAKAAPDLQLVNELRD